MSQSQVVSFRASGHFLNWIEAQRLDGESVSQSAQRILKEVSGTSISLSTLSTPSDTNALSTLSTPSDTNALSTLSTRSNDSVVSTNIVDIVDKAVSSSLDPVIEQMAAIEERLGKLSA